MIGVPDGGKVSRPAACVHIVNLLTVMTEETFVRSVRIDEEHCLVTAGILGSRRKKVDVNTLKKIHQACGENKTGNKQLLREGELRLHLCCLLKALYCTGEHNAEREGDQSPP